MFASGLTIHPGDVIRAEVSASGMTFTVSLTDATTGQSFSKTARVNSAEKSSAEWMAEAPSSSGGVLPLANFGTVNFGTDYTGVSSTNFATVSGVTRAIGSFGVNVQHINMVTSGGALKDTTSSLSCGRNQLLCELGKLGPVELNDYSAPAARNANPALGL